MSLPTNNKNQSNNSNKGQKNAAANSKFIKSNNASKPAPVNKKVRSTGANRGS